jgi:bla regulator protein blaR1
MFEALMTHLWQSTFFAVAAGLVTLAFRKNHAQVRYWLWLSASLKFFIPFALLMSLGSNLETHLPAAHEIATRIATPAISYTIDQFSELSLPESLPSQPTAPATTHWIPVAFLSVWLCGFAAIALVRFRNWVRVRNAIRMSYPVDVQTAVEVRAASGLLEPGVVGLWRPTLLLPEGIEERLSPSELKAVLAHELCHVRRRDNLFASIHMVVETLFWFHPLVWWIGARLVEERERACDEEVLSLGNSADVYADAILNVCKLYLESPLACVSGVSGAGIRRRIEAIMSSRKAQGLSRTKKLLIAAAGAVALAGPIAIGLVIGVGNAPLIHAQSTSLQVKQTPQTTVPPAETAQTQSPPAQSPPAPPPVKTPAAPRPKFDVVSVRRCMPGDELSGPPGGRGGGGGGRGPRFSPGRLRMQCLALDDMILTAYIDFGMGSLLNVDALPGDSRWLRNAPAWVKSDWYTIDAETDDPVANGPTEPRSDARRVLSQMLQLVLEDRFQLKVHRDTEDVPMYNLIVAKGGLKMKPMEDGGCIQRDPTKGYNTGEMFPAGQKPQCVGWLHMNGPNWVIDGAGQSLASLAGSLSGVLSRHVFDKTGTGALFSFNVEFAHDESTPGDFPPEIIDHFFPPSDIPPGSSIFTVLEGLGLKLEPTKGPQGIMVVDHVERPSEN